MPSKSELTPGLVKALCRAVRKYPNITAAADACGVNPVQFENWIRKGLYPNPDPLCGALAQAARRSLALCKGRLFQTIYKAAVGTDRRAGDPKWASYLLEQMKEPEEAQWSDTVPGESDMSQIRQHLFQNPSPKLLQDIADAGMALVPLRGGVATGELVDDE